MMLKKIFEQVFNQTPTIHDMHFIKKFTNM